MKHIKNFAGMILIALLLELVIKPGEAMALTPLISGVGDLSVDEWVRKWGEWCSITAGAGLFGFFLWYLIGVFSAPDFTGQTSKRPVWILLLIIPIVTVVAAFFLLPPADSFEWLAVIFLGVNALFAYWITSAGFSPARVKTAPVAGEPVRKLTDALPF